MTVMKTKTMHARIHTWMGLMVSAVGELEKTVLAMFTRTRKVVMIRAIRPETS